jgi:hypothetical protein
MDAPSCTHVLLDHDSGEPIGAIRLVDEMPDGTPFGLVRLFDGDELESYIWLDGLDVIRLAEAAKHVRNHVAWALAHPQAV